MKNEKKRCILCKKESHFAEVAKRLRDSEEHRVLQCGSCSLVQIWPTPNVHDDEKFYNENRQPRNIGIQMDLKHLRARQSHDTERRIALFKKIIPRGSPVLEVGSSYGFLLEGLRKNGYKPEGVELSRERVALSQQITKAPIFNVNLMNQGALSKTYPFIITTHVLEHIHDPVEFCSVLKSYLKKGGRLIAEVPNLDDFMLSASPAYKDFWWQRAHISYFGKKTLSQVFRQAGFKKLTIKNIQRYGIDNMMSWMVLGKPQIASPSFEANGTHRWLETHYKAHLEKTGQCDTLLAIATA